MSSLEGVDRLVGEVAGHATGHAVEARILAAQARREAERRLRDRHPGGTAVSDVADQLDDIARLLLSAAGLSADLLSQITRDRHRR